MATIHTSKKKDEAYEGLGEETVADEFSLAADSLGGLAEEIAKRQDKLAKSKAYKELAVLQIQYAEHEKALREGLGYKKGAVAEDESTVRGDYFVATLGQSSNSTTVTDKEGLAKWIEANFSKDELLALIKFGIGDLREYLPKKSFEKFTKTERTGGRKLTLKRHAADPDG